MTPEADVNGPDDAGETTPPPPRTTWSTLTRVGLAVATIVVLMLWILGAFRRDVIQAGKASVPAESATGLTTETIAAQTVPAMTEAVGTIQAEQLAAVTSRVVGTIEELRVAAGQRVASGAILAVLDNRDLRHRAEQAQEAVIGAEVAVAQAQADYARDKPLADQRVITAYDFEHTQTTLKTAEATWHRLQQAAREADVTLSYAVIRSPFAGVVVDRLANVGDLAAPGKPLFTLYEPQRLWLEANVPEDMLARVHIGEVLTLRIDARGQESSGRVVEIVPSSDPTTRTMVVRARLDNPRDLVPGMFGRLLIPSTPERMLTVPATAVTRAGQLTLVEVVDQHRVERRTVQLGRAFGDGFEVLSGLAAGDRVVIRHASPSAGGKDRP
jgi:RND family efflux transporter MFP subunit